MKNYLILGSIGILLLFLTACSGSVVEGSTTDETLSTYDLSINNLLLGTLRLEGTDLAINPEMASQLLPLWQAARTIYTSDTSAAAEQEAILNQIIEVMTAEQLEAIEAMDLSSEGMMQSLRETLGDALPDGFPLDGELTEGFPEPPEGMPDGARGFRPGQGFEGGPGLGQGTGEGFGSGMGQGLSPEAQATLQAERGGRGGRLVNPMMFEVIIELLQERAQEGLT